MNQKINKKIILLVNLGSPNELKTSSIRSFLSDFLSDKRVVKLPKLLWYPILYGIILPIRAKRLLKQYTKIWLNGSAPLIYYTKSIADKLQVKYQNDDTLVIYAFSYSKPSINEQLQLIENKYCITDLTVVPLYPQFSSTTTMSVFDQINKYYQNKYYLPNIRFINSFYNHIGYIDTIVNMINKYKLADSHLLFSYHSLPVAIIKNGDTYYEECLKTTELIVNKLGITNYSIAFQSRFGNQKWLTPSTETTVRELAVKKQINIICPGFVCDCLETLEEVAIINKAIFMNNGGEEYNYISCVNDNDQFIETLYMILNNSY